MELFNLFISALMPVLKVLLVTLVGSFLALNRVDILGMEARKHLNKVVFFVFGPALVSTNLAKYITFKSMVTLWFMPINIFITFVVGSALGWVLIKITRAPRHLRGLVLGCAAAGNLGNLPLIIVPAVCRERGSPFGDVDVCHGRAMAFASLSMAFGAIYMWSYVYNIMRIYVETDSQLDRTKVDEESPDTESHNRLPPPIPLKERGEQGDENEQKVVTFSKKLQELIAATKKLNIGRLFAPSTIGAIVGFIVGATPVFKKLLIGDTAPLRVVQDSAYFVGEAAIPTVTLIVGANLLKGLKGPKLQAQLPILLGIIVIRFLLLPIIGVMTIKWAVHIGLVKEDPLYQFVLLLQFALPPAVSIGTMTQLFGCGQTECSVIMLSTYVLATASLTLWCMFFMWFVG